MVQPAVRRLRQRPFAALLSCLVVPALTALLVACGSGSPAAATATAASATGASAAPSSSAATTATPAAAPVVSVQTQGALAPYLVGPNGHTLYVFAHDRANRSACAGACQQNWPPLVLSGTDEPTAVPAVKGTFNVIDRPGTGRQVTYNGWPLYYFQADAAPGDTKGNGVQGLWKVATPGIAAAP